MNKLIPFLKCDETTWKVTKAIETSLTVTEVSQKSNVNISTVSRLLSEIKQGSKGISVRFEIDMEKAGIISVATISKRYMKRLPFLQSFRVLRVLGRELYLYTALLPGERMINEWLSNFEEKSLTVRGLERRFWSPSSPLTVYDGEFVQGCPEQIVASEQNPPKLPEVEVTMDEVDILLYWGKSRWPFTSLREIAKESEKYLGRNVSHQLLSWHFKNHLLKLWNKNSVRLYLDLNKIPYRLLYMEGRDAPAVARALVQLPWFHTAYIDFDRAIVSGQPPCESMLPLYKQLNELDVNTLEFIMEPSLMRVVPIFNLLMSITKKLEVTAE
ncbi:MAG: hypothetical protein QW407_05795 [Thermofilaceae archaeon]